MSAERWQHQQHPCRLKHQQYHYLRRHQRHQHPLQRLQLQKYRLQQRHLQQHRHLVVSTITTTSYTNHYCFMKHKGPGLYRTAIVFHGEGIQQLKDGDECSQDLTGGYFDAGDYVKFNFPQAFSMTMLAWGMIEFKDGYEYAGEYSNGLSAIKWGTQYLLKCHTGRYHLAFAPLAV